MSEKHDQPADDASSLDDQLDNLLAKIEQESSDDLPEEAAMRRNTSTDESLDAMIDQEVDDAIAAAESFTDATEEVEPAAAQSDVSADADVDLGDALADQVQAMLDEAASQTSVADTLSEAEDDGIEEIDGDLSGSFHAPESITGEQPEPVAAVSSAAEPEQSFVSDHDSQDADLAELDRLLADEADDAIADEFESPQDVSSADPVAESAESDEALEGSFAAPDEVQLTGGTAESVAEELDDQPEQEVAVAEPVHETVEDDEDHPSLAMAMLPRLEWCARHTCAFINAPMNRLSAELRFLVGLAGVATTVVAVGLIVLALIF